MHKIDSSSAVPTMPVPSAPGAPGYFAHGSPGGAPYTILTSDWANAIQMEICNVITGAGITLSKNDSSQLLAAINSLVDSGGSGSGSGTGSNRIKLTAPLDLYVSTTGNDTNNGLTASTPFRTLQKPVNLVYTDYDLAGQTVVVHVANGTYTAGVLHQRPLTGAISFVGNTTTPTACKVALTTPGACFASMYGAILTVSGFALESSAVESPGYWSPRGMGLMSSWHGSVLFDRIAFGPITYAHMTAGAASFINVSGNATPYSIYGPAFGHMIAGIGSTIHMPSTVVSITNNPAFTYFAWANQGGISAPGVTYTGTATGARYLADSGGFINTNGAGANYFPGSAAGTSTTGYYT